jgi:lysine 2,3-aminomutase
MYHGNPGPTGAKSGQVVGRPELLARRPDLVAIWDAANALFPVRVTRSFHDRIDWNDPNDPLARQVLPAAEELVPAPGDLLDPVGDKLMSPQPWVVRKHDDRVLVLLTKRCHVYCRYCFRRNIEHGAEDPTPAELDAALLYAKGSGAHEAIFSGGDPLAVTDARLFAAIDAVRPEIPVIRIHTRAPIALPSRVTPELVAGLRKRAPVWVIVHTNHPRELAPDVDEALARLVDAGLPVLNQSVLLAGVNDDPDVLQALSEALVERRVLPYYLHHPDAAAGNAGFRLTIERGLAIHAELARRVSGLALPAYVIDPPDGSGKIPVANR